MKSLFLQFSGRHAHSCGCLDLPVHAIGRQGVCSQRHRSIPLSGRIDSVWSTTDTKPPFVHPKIELVERATMLIRKVSKDSTWSDTIILTRDDGARAAHDHGSHGRVAIAPIDRDRITRRLCACAAVRVSSLIAA